MSRPGFHPARRRVRLWLGAAFALCLFPLAPRLSRPLDSQLRLPATPLDTTDPERARQWLFLDSCRPFLPPEASFTVTADDPETEMALFMMAIGVFPAGAPHPHSYYGLPTPEEARKAHDILEYGRFAPADPRARPVARVTGGSISERATEP
jgi:hypothetical protein